MPLRGRVFVDDEELGKKNDDHRPRDGVSYIPALWIYWRVPGRIRRNRLLFSLLGLLIVYTFIRNLPPGTDINQRLRVAGSAMQVMGTNSADSQQGVSQGPPPRASELTAVDEHYYGGPISFLQLGISLHGISKTQGHNDRNRNVLFATSSLRSVGELIPVACEMARWRRAFVHIAILGRENLPIEAIQEINGIGPECGVYWHDARPDYSLWSSDFRMEMSVSAALGYLHDFIHPQVVITDDLRMEDSFFTKVVRAKTTEFKISMIEVPFGAVESLMWVSRLDSASLAAWNTAHVDILIQAPSDSSGSLIRLLRSIEKADYFNSQRPHITIELPPDVGPHIESFLQNFIWPPIDTSGVPYASLVTVRHRIPQQRISTEEAASRFFESFYPARPLHSHVLIISPQAELSSNYYHYLKYSLLEYKYSWYLDPDLSDNLMGLSLELPTSYLNDSTPFNPPMSESTVDANSTQPDQPISFLWQAPNSNAVLYFGDKWIELHSFLANRISAQKIHAIGKRPKLVSKRYPSWMEYVLELMRARGYYLLYPWFTSSNTMVTVHNELYQPPEEFSFPLASGIDESAKMDDINEPFSFDPSSDSIRRSKATESPLLASPLLSILPFSGDLSELSTLPVLSYSGIELAPADLVSSSASFTSEFRREIGGCSNGRRQRAMTSMSADDLFCFSDDKDDNQQSAGSQTSENADADKSDSSQQSKEEFAAHLARQEKAIG